MADKICRTPLAIYRTRLAIAARVSRSFDLAHAFDYNSGDGKIRKEN
jgi:hypothetical protein